MASIANRDDQCRRGICALAGVLEEYWEEFEEEAVKGNVAGSI